MAILNTQLQLRGTVNNTHFMGIPKIYLGMQPLPLKGVTSGNAIAITESGKGIVKVRTVKVGSGVSPKNSGMVLGYDGSTQSMGRHTGSRKTKSNGNRKSVFGNGSGKKSNGKKSNGKKTKGQKRINGRFAK